MSLHELNQDEISQVTGAGLVGNTLIGTVNVFNQVLNTKLISSVGEVFSGVGLGLVHQVADTTGLVASKTLVGLGRLLGGDLPESQNHYEKESSEGYYVLLPTYLFGRNPK